MPRIIEIIPEEITPPKGYSEVRALEEALGFSREIEILSGFRLRPSDRLMIAHLYFNLDYSKSAIARKYGVARVSIDYICGRVVTYEMFYLMRLEESNLIPDDQDDLTYHCQVQAKHDLIRYYKRLIKKYEKRCSERVKVLAAFGEI